MSWRHWAFISYVQSNSDSYKWVHGRFIPALRKRLVHEHGWPLDERPELLWVDTAPGNVPGGSPVSAAVATALRESCVVVPVLTGAYFQRPWCRFELYNAVKRQEAGGPPVCPVWASDGDHFEDWAEDMKRHDLRYLFDNNRFINSTRVTLNEIAKEIHNRKEQFDGPDLSWPELTAPPAAQPRTSPSRVILEVSR
jgi:hypothetical protein